jgi:hypothetical protein
MLDQRLHMASIECISSYIRHSVLIKLSDLNSADFDLAACETREKERLGLPEGIILRHRPPHFQRQFALFIY